VGAVVQAMRGAGRDAPGHESMPNLNGMSDSEFAAWTAKNYGYTSKVI
jgi:hypothetical protein